MHYHLQGQVSVQVCRDCPVAAISGFLRLFLDAKEFHETHVLDEKRLEALAGNQVGREPVSSEGNFQMSIDDRQKPYHGGPLVAVMEATGLSSSETTEPKNRTRNLVLGIFQPEWKQTDHFDVSCEWQVTIQPEIWCPLCVFTPRGLPDCF